MTGLHWSWRWLVPFSLPADALEQLKPYLGDRLDDYAREAGISIAVQRWEASEAHAGLKEIRAQLEAIAKGGPVQSAAAPHLIAALMVNCGVSHPEGASPTMLARAAAIALDELPVPKRGRPRRPAVPGRDLLEDELLAIFARLTGRPANCADAAACAYIVTVAAGLHDPVDPESRQRAQRRRRN